jgi:hypothetical protein
MANIIPSGKAGFMTLMSITKIPIENPYTHLPILVLAADTGSVAINTNPKAKLPIVRCHHHGTVNIGFVSDPTRFKKLLIRIIPIRVARMILQEAIFA